MPLILPGNVASATAGAYSIANSCRFNYADDPYLSFTPSSAVNTDRWTISFWIKKTDITESTSGTRIIGFNDGSNEDFIEFYYSPGYDVLKMDVGDGVLVTNRVFRDPAAWYHIVAVLDSANASAGNRMRLYVNGVEETSFATDTNPSSGDDAAFGGTGSPIWIGGDEGSRSIKGYLAEIALCDGQAYAASDFGEFNSDSPTIWQPKDISGLTFGTSGFWLDFEDSSALGNDVSGNNNDFAVTSGLLAVDQATDTPTNSFCTINPLDNYYAASTFSEGNCKIVTNSSNRTWNTGTIGLTAGKWYWEVKATEMSSDYQLFGISDIVSTSTTRQLGQDTYSYALNGDNGTIYSNSSSSSADWEEIAQGDIIGHYLDLDNNKMYWAKNGTVMNSGTGFSITAAASTGTGFYLPAFGEYAASDTLTAEANFGGCSAFTVSSAVADANGYGAFEYDPSSGTFDSASKDFLAICTKNLGSDGG